MNLKTISPNPEICASKPTVVFCYAVKVIDTDAPSYSNRSPESVLESRSSTKKKEDKLAGR